MDRAFWAAHAVEVGGRPEPLHRHNWLVRVVVAGERLDPDGLLVDFQEIGRRLDGVLDRLSGRNLNECGLFEGSNPTAERVAHHVAHALALPDGVRLVGVRVIEAPGCAATYRP